MTFPPSLPTLLMRENTTSTDLAAALALEIRDLTMVIINSTYRIEGRNLTARQREGMADANATADQFKLLAEVLERYSTRGKPAVSVAGMGGDSGPNYRLDNQ